MLCFNRQGSHTSRRITVSPSVSAPLQAKVSCSNQSKPRSFYRRAVFISRLTPGGLAANTGLLAVNDEVLEVNGIDVAGKTLDQVSRLNFLLLVKLLFVVNE